MSSTNRTPSSTDAASLKSTLSARVRGLDAEIPTYSEFVMRELLERSTAERRFVMLLLAGFGLAALLIAGVGICGTVSQAVAQRTQEIGVRMALGAPRRGVATGVWRGIAHDGRGPDGRWRGVRGIGVPDAGHAV